MPSHSHDIEAQIYALRTNEGGRKGAMRSGCRPSHDFGKNGHLNDGMHKYPDGGRIDPGSSGRALIWLLAADENHGLLCVGDSFTVQEGNRVVGRGKITGLGNAELQKKA
jgi:translation elongation factor EF-Tu-like GTPase